MSRKDALPKLTAFKIFETVVVLACMIVFVILIKTQYTEFSSEQTGTSLKWKPIDKLPFPALSICNSHYENARVKKDFGVPPPLIPSTTLKEYRENPLSFYKMHIVYDGNIEQGIWDYYMTLDKIINTVTEADYDSDTKHCRVGSHSCDLVAKAISENPKPAHVNMTQEFEVPAGKWVSRVMADSDRGNTYFCHTLIPNVTVDFGVKDGNSIGLQFLRNFIRKVPYCKIFIHDQFEHVTLPSYALETMASMTILKYDGINAFAHKGKAIIKPRLIELPEPSELLPCQVDPQYSQNWCQIKWGWQQKLQEMKDHFADRFNCIIPGIWANDTDTKPICNLYESESNNGSLGFIEIMNPLYPNHPILTYPPIGIHKQTSECNRRCSRYDYSLLMEHISEYDEDMQR